MWWLGWGLHSWGVWLPSLWRCDVLGQCGGVWGRPAGNQIIVLKIFPISSFACNLVRTAMEFSFNFINFKTPYPPVPPISSKNVSTHFNEESSIYTVQSIPNLNSSPNPCATHFPNPLQYLLRACFNIF